MSTPKGHTPIETGLDTVREMSRAISNQERRPQIRQAKDLLGPGFGATATELLDWNSSTARFNGFWFSVDALNGPTLTGRYLGLTVASSSGEVTQLAISHDLGTLTGNRIYSRRLHTQDSQAAAYSPWEQVHPSPSGVPSGAVVFIATTAALPSGWVESTATPPSGLRAIQKV